jgi:transposase
MDAPSCPGCQQRDEVTDELRQRLAALEAHVRQVEDLLGRNATNSSLPPSANPPGAPKPASEKPSGRTTGAQPGHSAHLRRRLPPQRVQHTRDFTSDNRGRAGRRR